MVKPYFKHTTFENGKKTNHEVRISFYFKRTL